MRPALAAHLVAVGPHNPLTAPYGYNDHLAELIGEGRGADHVAREMPEEWVDELAVGGDLPLPVAERKSAG